jgi:hypothetical protein
MYQQTIHYLALTIAVIFWIRVAIQTFLTYQQDNPKYYNSMERANLRMARKIGYSTDFLKPKEILYAIIATVVFLTT